MKLNPIEICFGLKTTKNNPTNIWASTVFHKMMPMYILKYMDMHIIVIQMTQKITTYMHGTVFCQILKKKRKPFKFMFFT